jgi:NAD(P)-dependent dehydrogenase (short-subunit alcohol dehydrogenase family)
MRERVGRVEGKVALVTGAGSVPGAGVGTGKAIAISLAREGAKLVLVDLFPERAEETKAAIEAEGGEAIVVKADCTKWRDCSEMVIKALDAFGRIDILVNNLGLASGGLVTDMYERDWDRTFDINLRTVYLACKYTIPVMLAQKSGAVINLSSLSAQRPGRTTAYSAAKAGVEAMTFDMAFAYGRKGVRVNCVLPGNINTPIASNVLKTFPGHERMQRFREECGMLGIPGDAWDIAHAVVYLASEEARFITGVTLPVDAGMLKLSAMSLLPEFRVLIEQERLEDEMLKQQKEA